MSGQPPARGSRRGGSVGYSSPRGNSGFTRGSFLGRGRGRADIGSTYFRGRGTYPRLTSHPSHTSFNAEPYPTSRGGYRGRGGHVRPHENSYASRSPPDFSSGNPSTNYGDPKISHHGSYNHNSHSARGPFDPPFIPEKNLGNSAGLHHEYTLGLALKQEMDKCLQLANKTTGYYIGFISKHGNQIIPSLPRDL